MALATNLMGVGVNPEAASRIGVNIQLALAAAGTTAAAATAIKYRVTTITTASSEDSVILPSSAELGSVWEVYNTSSTTANVFPPTSGTIDGGSANAAVTIAENKGRIFRRLSSVVWVSNLTA